MVCAFTISLESKLIANITPAFRQLGCQSPNIRVGCLELELLLNNQPTLLLRLILVRITLALCSSAVGLKILDTSSLASSRKNDQSESTPFVR